MSAFLFFLGIVTMPLNQLRPPGANISITNALFVLAVGVSILEWLLGEKSFDYWIPNHPLWIPSLLLLTGGLLSSINAQMPGSSIMVTLKLWFVLSLWMSMGIRLARQGHGNTIVTLLILGSVFSSCIAISDFVSGTRTGLFFISETSRANRTYYHRYGGTLGHPNEQAMYLAVVLPLTLDRILIQNESHKLWAFVKRLMAVVAFVVVLFAGVLTGSVAAYAGMLVSCTIVVLGHVRQISLGNILLFLYLLGLFTLATLTLFPGQLDYYVLSSEWLLRLSDASARNLQRVVQDSLPARLDLIRESREYIGSIAILGAGMDQTGTGELDRNMLVTTRTVHNTIAESWVAGGILAFFGIVLIYWKSLKLAIRNIAASTRYQPGPHRLALSASIIGFFLIDMTQPSLYQRSKWLMVALLYGVEWLNQKGQVDAQE